MFCGHLCICNNCECITPTEVTYSTEYLTFGYLSGKIYLVISVFIYSLFSKNFLHRTMLNVWAYSNYYDYRISKTYFLRVLKFL